MSVLLLIFANISPFLDICIGPINNTGPISITDIYFNLAVVFQEAKGLVMLQLSSTGLLGI